MSLLLDALRKAEAARAQLRKNSPLPPVADALPAVNMARGEIPMRGAANRNTLQDLTQRFEQDQLGADAAAARAAAQEEAAQAAREREQAERRAADNARATVPPSASPSSPLIALGLAVAIFLGAVVAWHVQPWRAPHPAKGEKLPLKLDYRLDLTRKSPSAPPGPGTTRP